MISLEKVNKSYNGKDMVVKDLDLTINTGELVVLVGESGCGKTTTMKMINRLETPSSGSIKINDKDILDFDPMELRRNIGYVIQKVGLFPHLTVGQNIGTVPKLEKKDPYMIQQRTIELLDMVDLPHEVYLDRYPNELSGGQQQRVGVARALANEPEIILMDEPFSALDPITRDQLQNELLKLQGELHKTIVFVTHDIDEAIKIGDRIAVMQDGNIVQYDTPENILKHPATDFIETFVGKDRLWKTPEMLRAEDVMRKDFVKIGMNRPIGHAIELMKEKNCEVLVVVEGDGNQSSVYRGMVGKRQLNTPYDHEVKMKDILRQDIITVDPQAQLTQVLTLRDTHQVRHIPVVEDGAIVGLVTAPSILNVLTDIIPESEGA
ncbi:MAG: betaine/proline/choline family ABC transporter ATP-binding protein [Eubacteriales bacterium]